MAPSTIECWGAGDGIIDIVKFIIDEDKYYEDEEKAHQYMEKNYEEWGDYDTQRNILIDIKDISSESESEEEEEIPKCITCNKNNASINEFYEEDQEEGYEDEPKYWKQCDKCFKIETEGEETEEEEEEEEE